VIPSTPGTVVEHFHAAVASSDGAWARVHRDGAWVDLPYAQLARTVEVRAAGLIAYGIRRGDRVALLCATRPEWTEFDYAILCAGATTIPIYPTNAPEECLHVLRDSAARVVVCESAEQRAKVELVRGELTDLERVVVLDDATLVDLEAAGEALLADDPGVVTRRSAEVAPEDPCTFVYTSGTTGPPKGCVILHRNYHAMVEMERLVGVISSDSVVYLFLPLAHVFARLAQFHAVADGAMLAFTRGPERIADDLLEVHPTVLPSVPRVFEKIHASVMARGDAERGLKRRIFRWAIAVGTEVSRRREAGQPIDRSLARRLALADRLVLSKVRARLGGVGFCISGGAPVSPDVLRLLHACGITVLEGYGMTESATAITINRPDTYRFGTVGPVFPGGELAIAADGEVLYRGPNVFAGYHGQPAATAATLVDGWLHTGDVGSIDADGYLSITDRKKDIIITAGGKNITPSNLENGLKVSPYISEACVVGDRRPYLVALVTVDADEVRRYAAAHGIGGDDATLRSHPTITALVDAQLAIVNGAVAPVEQVKRYAILDASFSQATGELTPTLKLKRRVVVERYAATIEMLYA
jgi:long-chain acyl-CoA synthetase